MKIYKESEKSTNETNMSKSGGNIEEYFDMFS